MLFTDVNEESAGTHAEVFGFLDTDENFVITKFLNGQRVCLYLYLPLRDALDNRKEGHYIDFVDLVTESNENYSIEVMTFFPNNLEDHTLFSEPSLTNKQQIFEGVYLFEKEDWVAGYLEDLDAEKEKQS